MTDATVIRLDDAKAMRLMGVPLNTPVIEKTFSPQVAKQIDKASLAFANFRKRIDAFFDNKNRSGFYAMRRAHDKLIYLIRQAQTDAEWKESADGSEREMVNHEKVAAALWIERLSIATDGWQELFDLADEAGNAGESITFTPEQFAALWPFNGKHLFRPDETP